MANRAELEFEGWRLSVMAQEDAYVWWVLSPAPARSIIKHDHEPTFERAVYTAYRTMQGLTGKPVPRPNILETP